MAQQSTYTQAAADEICERIANGEPLRVICRDEHMPAWRTVYGWINAHPDFEARIARARELGFDAIAEECIEIADDGSNDWMEKHDEKTGQATGYVLNGEHVQRSKLRIEARLKLLAKWSPKYADKQQIEHSGSVDIAATIVAARKRAGG